MIVKTIIDGEAVAGIPGLPLAQAFQPTMQGVRTKPGIYFFKVFDHPYGSPGFSDVWDEVNEKLVHTEVQQYETTFQLSVLATQEPGTPNQYTASDLLNLCSSILRSQRGIAALEAKGVGVLRVLEVRNPYFKDDRGQHEAEPSMDVIFTHKQIIVSEQPVIETIEVHEYAI